MKKPILLLVILFPFAGLYAQNHSSVSESGDYNTAIIDQNGMHTSTVKQRSNATEEQNGNLVDVSQKNTSPNLSGNKSKVEQHGRSHKSTVIQTGRNTLESYIGSQYRANVANETYSSQYGTDNAGWQSITGSSSTQTSLTLIQNKTDNISIQVAQYAKSSKGYVAQSGIANTSWQKIEGTSNSASTTQLHNNNYSFQQIEGVNSEQNINKVVQTGDRNTSRISVDGNYNEFSLKQVGDDNELIGTSNNFNSKAKQSGDLNKSVLTQNGDENRIRLEQNGNLNTVKGITSSGAIQFGDNNRAVFSQDGDGNTIVSSQYGDKNKEYVDQSGTTSISNILQVGDKNSSSVFQGR